MQAERLGDLHIYRRWMEGYDLFNRVRALFKFASHEDRANGYIYSAGEQPWPLTLVNIGPMLLWRLQELLKVQFTIALYQGYRDGSGCDWHNDRAFDAQAILSLGVSRQFGIRRDSDAPLYTTVGHGDLMYMPPGFQGAWQHCVPVDETPGERISLVFRNAARD